MSISSRSIAIAILSASVVSCADGPTQPGGEKPEPDVVRFDVSGSHTGEFRAMHRPGVETEDAYALQLDDELYIVAYKYSPDRRSYDDFAIKLRKGQVGTITCGTMRDCPAVTEAGVGMDGRDPGVGYAPATSLRVTISAFTQSNVKGTFEMTAEFGSRARITVTRGTFDVPLSRRR